MSESETTAVSFEDATASESVVTDVGIDSFNTDSGTSTTEWKDDTDEDTYTSDDGSQGADDVDPRKLFRTSSLDEIRWYYREGVFGSTIVEKPIKDAFKHGYEIKNDPTTKVREFLDEYQTKYIAAKIKSRRDGFAALFWQLKDPNSVNEAPKPSDVREVSGFDILTIDRTTDAINVSKVADYVGLDREQIKVSENGIVYVDDFTSTRHEELLGYGVRVNDHGKTTFVHADRCQHFASHEFVDGDVDSTTIGKFEGDSVLTPVLHPLRALAKGYWGTGQTLFRYSAPLFSVETPEDYGQDEFEQVDEQMNNLNMASSVTLPPACSLKAHDAASEFDPQPFFEMLVEGVCAGTEMTKSVLMGTQTGTVSGSETDIKNYFNQVERLRQNDIRNDLDEAVRMMNRFDKSRMPSWALGYNLKYEPLFKVDTLERMEAAVRMTSAVSNGVTNYILSVEDAQKVLEQAWTEVDFDVDLDELTESEMDLIDRITQNKQGTQYGANSEEGESEGNPKVGQNGGGMEKGQTTSNSNPTAQ